MAQHEQHVFRHPKLIIYKLQNHAARITTGSRHDATSNSHIKQLCWRTIEEMIEHESQVMAFKSVNGLAPQYLHELFIRNSTNPCI